jgi:hypothetical protein
MIQDKLFPVQTAGIGAVLSKETSCWVWTSYRGGFHDDGRLDVTAVENTGYQVTGEGGQPFQLNAPKSGVK